MQSSLRKFFAEYEARMNKALGEPPEIDVEATAEAFADCFVEASPVGIVCGNKEQLRPQIPKGYEFYRSIGTTFMKIMGLETTQLDNLHTMAKVHWDSRYVKKDGKKVQIEFDVIYLLQLIGDTPKIFAYITGDEQKVLKEHGLISA
jgi:hypothetical protein